jgi:hypothetical protein
MPFEAWAYVLTPPFLRCATGSVSDRVDDSGARRLTALITPPRPAMAARVKLAAEADGADPVTLAQGTAFRPSPSRTKRRRCSSWRAEGHLAATQSLARARARGRA